MVAVALKQMAFMMQVVNELKKGGVAFVDCDGIKPNPPVADVRKGIKLYRENNCNFILAVGGGSTIDCLQKAMAAGRCVLPTGDCNGFNGWWQRRN